MLLLDQNISYKVAKKLSEAFPGIVHVSDINLLNATDIQIWEFAKTNKYAIVTFDNDFFNLSLLKGAPPKIILLKAGNRKTQSLIALLAAQKDAIFDFLSNTVYNDIACLELR